MEKQSTVSHKNVSVIRPKRVITGVTDEKCCINVRGKSHYMIQKRHDTVCQKVSVQNESIYFWQVSKCSKW